MTNNEGLGDLPGDGTKSRGDSDEAKCSLVRKIQLSAGCVDSGYEHLKQDAIHVAMQDAVQRWDAGEACGLMFLSLGSTGAIRLGRVDAPASSCEASTKELGHAVWMMACDASTTALLMWTDCGKWAERSRHLLGGGQMLMQCIDKQGCQTTVVLPRREIVLKWSNHGEGRLIEVPAWEPTGAMALN